MGARNIRPTTVGEALQATAFSFKEKNIGSPRLEAEVLLASLLETTRAGLLARLRDPFPEDLVEKLKDLVARRLDGCPLQYLTGKQEFWGLDFLVGPSVLIPRQDTELLVEEVIGILRRHSLTLAWPPSPRDPTEKCLWLADVGTGSGAIAVALAKEMANLRVVATDISPGALLIAQENARTHRVDSRVIFARGDLLQPVINSGIKLHAVVSNPPYIPSEDIPTLQREVALFEPRNALDGGIDGLNIYRRLITQTKQVLLPGGTLVLEIGYQQGQSVPKLLTENGFTNIRVVKDLNGHDRVVLGKHPR